MNTKISFLQRGSLFFMRIQNQDNMVHIGILSLTINVPTNKEANYMRNGMKKSPQTYKGGTLSLQ